MTKIDPIEVPRLMFNSDAEFKIVKKHYGDLARKGIIVSISGPYFNFLHDQDIGQTRDYVKSMTRHNDKLGFDWNKP